jgi:HD-GYP domain-containing protein (c-di-GMP phosphodiesterase class II)
LADTTATSDPFIADFLRSLGFMSSRLSLTLGVLTGTILVAREHRARRAVERFAAAALETLLNAIEANDAQTGMHVRRVAAYALIIAEAAGLDERQRRAVERVALFHDIGKIHEALFDIVHEDRRLTASERRAIATHPARGAEVLEPLDAFYPELAAGVLAHHERWDGSGYPRGLRGKRIPFTSRIVAIADTFDAVAHSRRYHRGSGVGRALDVVRQGRGTQFDPEFVDLLALPPIADRFARQTLQLGRKRQGRRSHEHESVPDVKFRWRSESLGARRVRTARHGG